MIRRPPEPPLFPTTTPCRSELAGGHGLRPADVHARTGGNPFFVSQILAQPDSPLPESVREAVVARTAALAPPVRRALELLSGGRESTRLNSRHANISYSVFC